MTRPWRRITLHLSQIGLTLGLTFMSALSGSAGRLLVPVDDATPGEVVGGQLHHHAVLGEDPGVVLAHLAADVGEHLVSVGQLDPEHGVGKGLHDGALHLDHAFLLRHVLRNLLIVIFSTVDPGTAPAGAGWTSCNRSVSLIPGARSTPLPRGEVSACPGSREAPQNEPTLGRRNSLARTRARALIGTSRRLGREAGNSSQFPESRPVQRWWHATKLASRVIGWRTSTERERSLSVSASLGGK